jgi:nucleoside 2-deoxyribosyltransferase
MSELPRCYVASPLGFTEAGRHYYAEVLLPALRSVVEPVDPWALTVFDDWSREVALDAGRANAAAIRSCSLVAAVLDGQEVDSGVAAEVGYACALGIRCFGLRTDLRTSGEVGVAVNLQVEWFISESGGRIVASLDELVAALGS